MATSWQKEFLGERDHNLEDSFVGHWCRKKDIKSTDFEEQKKIPPIVDFRDLSDLGIGKALAGPDFLDRGSAIVRIL